MALMDKSIVLWVSCGTEEHELKTYEGEYRNLMMLIYDRISIPCFGECTGMGRCGTCIVAVSSRKPLSGLDRNEQTTIARLVGAGQFDYRLACQLLIDQSLH
jgi:2Fe-2S ferredoxin